MNQGNGKGMLEGCKILDLTQYLAGAQAIGPFLQGFARPVCDLSRGATVDDIAAAAAIALLQAASETG